MKLKEQEALPDRFRQRRLFWGSDNGWTCMHLVQRAVRVKKEDVPQKGNVL